MSSQKHYHDPINYLRAAREGDDAAVDDLRRYDSDDDLLGPVSERHLDYSLDGISDQDLAAATTTEKEEDGDDQQTKRPPEGGTATTLTTPPPPAIPKPERRAYRPQSVGTKPQPPARERPDLGSAWPYRETLSFTRNLVFYGAGSITKEHERACAHIQEARALRQKYFGGRATLLKFNNDLLKDFGNLSIRMGQEGVAEIFHSSQTDTNLVVVPNVEQFSADYSKLVELSSEGAMRSFCFQRLQMLSTSFKMHTTLNTTIEMEEQSNLLGTDFYRTMKVDNHIHAAAAPSAKQVRSNRTIDVRSASISNAPTLFPLVCPVCSR